MSQVVFISYATKDKELFDVPELKEYLEQVSFIDKALYWEEDCGIDLYDYMEKGITECTYMIVLCSQNYLQSEMCRREWQAADRLGKQIIPVFFNEKHVPALLLNMKGVKIYSSTLQIENFELIADEIAHRMNLKLDAGELAALMDIERILGETIPAFSDLQRNRDMFGFVADQGHVVELCLCDKGLTFLPGMMGKLVELKKLNLYRNQLSSLPEIITQMTRLESLNLGENQLSSIPGMVSQLISLKGLGLGANQLCSLPEGIGRLGSLQVLDVVDNQLSSLPESIGGLRSLEALFLHENQLTSLPDSIGQLANLEELELYDNKLSSLPESIGNLQSLQRLFLHSNQLSSLPESIGRLANLQELDLYDNKLSSLPESIVNLTKLKGLYLYGNQLSALTGKLKVWFDNLESRGCSIMY